MWFKLLPLWVLLIPTLLVSTLAYSTNLPKDCSTLLIRQWIQTETMPLSEQRYQQLRQSIVDAYNEQMQKREKWRSLNNSLGFEFYLPALEVRKAPYFQIEYSANGIWNRVRSELPILNGEQRGVLILGGDYLEWFGFLAQAIFQNDLALLLNEVAAFTVAFIFYIPQWQLVPAAVQLTPVVGSELQRELMQYQTVEVVTPKQNWILQNQSLSELLKQISFRQLLFSGGEI